MNKFLQFFALSLINLSFSLPVYAAECTPAEKLKLIRSGVSDAEIRNLCEGVADEKKDQAQTDKQAPVIVNINQDNNQTVNQTQNNNQTNNASNSQVNFPKPREEHFFWEIGIGYSSGEPSFSEDIEHENSGLAVRFFPLTYFPNSIHRGSLGFGFELGFNSGERTDYQYIGYDSGYDNWYIAQNIFSLHYVLNTKKTNFYLIPYIGYGSGEITRDFGVSVYDRNNTYHGLNGTLEGSITSLSFGLRAVNGYIHEDGGAFAINLRYTSYSDSELKGNYNYSSSYYRNYNGRAESEVDGFSIFEITASYLW